MKKKLESELISIAHRVLKLKNRSETKQLQEETRKLYDQLTVLRFYEENIDIVEKEISLADLETKLENPKVSDVFEKPLAKEVVEIPVVEALVEEIIIEEEIEIVAEAEEEAEEEVIEEKALVHEEDFKQLQSVLFEDVFGSDFSEPDFVKVNDVPVEVEQVTEIIFDKIEDVLDEDKEDVVEESENVQPPVVEEVLFEAKSKSLNDKLTRGINIGLNDRIAFEKKLFGGSSDDFNRVLSQLNTFDSFDEVNGFINDFVKPDYNNWEGKEEYETRFLEIVEKKFN